MSELLLHRISTVERSSTPGWLPDGFDPYWRPDGANQSTAEAQWLLAEVDAEITLRRGGPDAG